MALDPRKLFAMVIVVMGLCSILRVFPVSAAGTLYISPNITQPLNIGSLFTVQVKVSGFDQFNGWEVQVLYDTRVINATSIDTSGNIFLKNVTGGTGYELRNCVNGNGTGCCLTNACSPQDGMGIASSTYGYAGARLASGSGLLFKLNFTVVGSGTYSPIIIENDKLSNGGSSGVVHTTLSGSYGVAPDFTLAASPPELRVFVGSQNATAITLTSVDSFSGTVNLTAAPVGGGITTSFAPAHVQLLANGMAVSNLLVQALSNSPSTSYDLVVNATSSSLPKHSLPHTLHVTIFVVRPDFEVLANPSQLLTQPSSSNSTTITVKSDNKFNGTVNLVVTGPTVASLSQSSVYISAGTEVNVTLSVTTQPSATRFEDDFIVNGTSVWLGVPLVHTVTVVAQPPPGDFSISAQLTTPTVQAGNAETVTVGVTSLNFFVGQIYLLGTVPSGLNLTFEPSNFFLNYSQTVSTKMIISTDPSIASGNHTVILTVLGQYETATTQIPHSIQLILTVQSRPLQVSSQPTSFLGLSEPVFYSILGGLAAVLAVIGVFEARRSGRPKSRPILES